MEEILASIRRIIADDQESARAPEPPRPAPRPVPPDEDDVLDLATIAPAPPPRPKLDLEHEDVSFREAEFAPVDFGAFDDEEPPPEPEPVPELPPVQARAPEPPPASPLISEPATAAVGQAFNMLAHTVLSNNARTLEDLVKDMLRPMLKNWLDDNLPVLVERLVRAEIERVSRGGR